MGMGETFRTYGAAALALFASMFAGSTSAQETANDAAARQYFENGREAFESADYERALVYFRHAYRLSQRPELQYNVGVAADRLQREDEALEAFEQYLEDTKQPEREAEVRERIEALRESIEEREATERALVEATIQYEASDPITQRSDGGKLPTSAIAGGSTLAAAGAAGVAAMAVGIARDGSCKEERGGSCVTQNSATAWSWVYGGLGLAALAGSATWFAVSYKRTKAKRETAWRITPSGVVVSGKF
jgi:tetratricopeptide (TPR) repeat protein